MIKKFFAAILALALGANVIMAVAPTYAVNDFTEKACAEVSDPAQYEALGCNTQQNVPSAATTLIKGIIGVLGVVAVIIIIVSGQRYIVSQGDPGKVAQAKAMLIYAIIGLVVAMLSFAIVSFIEANIFG